MGSPFLELSFGYGVKVKVKSEVKGQILPKIRKTSLLLTDYMSFVAYIFRGMSGFTRMDR